MNKYDSNVYLLGPNPNCLTNLAIIQLACFADGSWILKRIMVWHQRIAILIDRVIIIIMGADKFQHSKIIIVWTMSRFEMDLNTSRLRLIPIDNSEPLRLGKLSNIVLSTQELSYIPFSNLQLQWMSLGFTSYWFWAFGVNYLGRCFTIVIFRITSRWINLNWYWKHLSHPRWNHLCRIRFCHKEMNYKNTYGPKNPMMNHMDSDKPDL